MNFAEAEKYLYSLGNEVSAMKLGLDAMRALLSELGDPHEKYLKVQVAGTNGKGSVCAFLDAICNAANLRVGTLTSPHLVSITERVRINGRDISEDEFARLATVVRDASERLVARQKLDGLPTFFEQVTAIGLLAFAESEVEIAILETGLGGRLDATTAADAEIAVITRIDLDHQEYLGDTIEKNAAEKAAIIHHGSKVVVGSQRDEALMVIEEWCRTVGADVVVMPTASSGSADFELGLRGRHQVENAAIAEAAASVIGERLAVSDEAIAEGFRNARHPGRLEYRGRYLFDGAHNVLGATTLASHLHEVETLPVTMIFGAMGDKDIETMLGYLAPVCERIIFTEPANERAASYEQLIEALPAKFSREKVFACDSVEKALVIADETAGEDDLILVTGSLYLVGEVKKLVGDQSEI